jgi:hypothetical protein
MPKPFTWAKEFTAVNTRISIEIETTMVRFQALVYFGGLISQFVLTRYRKRAILSQVCSWMAPEYSVAACRGFCFKEQVYLGWMGNGCSVASQI